MQTLTTAARRLYDPARELAATKKIPAGRTTSTPTSIDMGSFRTPDGVVVDRVRFQHYTGILSDFRQRIVARPHELDAALHDLAQKLLDMHGEEQQQLQGRMATEYDRPHIERWTKQRQSWRQAFANDPEIGRNRKDTTLSRARAMLENYGKSVGAEHLAAFRKYFDDSGAGDHPEMLRFVNWVAAKLGKAAR